MEAWPPRLALKSWSGVPNPVSKRSEMRHDIGESYNTKKTANELLTVRLSRLRLGLTGKVKY